MRVLVTGGTGFIGQALCPLLLQQGHQVVLLTRQLKPRLPEGVKEFVNQLQELEKDSIEAVINLAGAGIADKRWSEERKKRLVNSRVETTRQLVKWMITQNSPPQVLVSASAVGYYGEQGDRIITEDTPPEPGFTYDLCAAWEAEALRAEEQGIRVCLVRTGVVLDQGGGSLAKMLPAFKLGLGGPLGSGQHWFPWIHREDMARIYVWLVENKQTGVFNASAPHPVRNREFTQALGKALKRPAFMPMPAFVLKLMFGEMADLLLVSDRMQPQRLEEAGFEFRYPKLDQALERIFSG
ncbi:TIGR01777 family oxidoreductase [Marinospirillum sp.]|uniref:TIGR01777 family oxidoreductase n=1 Tax=Marinospirillum sp. TaxID=2183934 RepID=UPI002870A332|nr:TIGR01777 family oxidoreductase [Marinospirillum sp.]MDR9468615.1 TIGR01777 family oxidoreductase [Marinospirillum sp.]